MSALPYLQEEVDHLDDCLGLIYLNCHNLERNPAYWRYEAESAFICGHPTAAADFLEYAEAAECGMFRDENY